MIRENFKYVLVSLTVLFASGIYSCSTRYQAINDPQFSRTIIVDRWTGNVTVRH